MAFTCPKRFRNSGYGHGSFRWEKYIKYTLCWLNVLFILGGLTIIAIGIWTIIDKLSLESLLGTNLYISAAWILIGTGCAVILIAFFGCIGALRRIRCMLFTYFVILFLIFVVLLLGGILGYVFREKVEESMRQQMHDTMIRDFGFVKVVTEAWDALQHTLQCCAVDSEYNLTSWVHSIWYENQINPRPFVPESCCRVEPGEYSRAAVHYVNLTACQGRYLSRSEYSPNPLFVYVEPCLAQAKSGVKDHAVVLGTVGISTACSLILGMIFAMILFREIE